MRVFLSSRVPRLTILGATMQEIEERPAPEAGCNISSFNRKSFSSQLRSKKGDEFLLNAIEGRNHYKNCTLATAFLKIKDWAHACDVGHQPDGVTPWDCVPSIDRASLRWDHLNEVFCNRLVFEVASVGLVSPHLHAHDGAGKLEAQHSCREQSARRRANLLD